MKRFSTIEFVRVTEDIGGLQVRARMGVHITAAQDDCRQIARILGERVYLSFNHEGFIINPDESVEDATWRDETNGYPKPGADWEGYGLY